MTNLFITVILLLATIVIFTWINNYDKKIKLSNTVCNMENFDIDKIHIIKREPEYQRLINKLIDEKRVIFNDEELKILKNKFQIYNVSDDDIQNITKILMLNCKKNLDTLNDNYEYTPQELQDVKYNLYNNIEYNRILNNLSNNEEDFYELDCENTKFLKCNNQKNYYYDLFGNNILSDTSQYMANYYSTINSEDEKYCVPVKTIPKKKPEGYNKNQLPITDQPYFDNPFDIHPLNEDYTDYIIPVQHYNDINLTNIYNIDNSRVINPYTIY
jgi:hypothetical protein